MTDNHIDSSRYFRDQWLRSYYFARAAFSVVWVIAAFTLGQSSPMIAAILLTIYPAWDAVANYFDAARSGGMAQSRTQAINVFVSLAATLAVIFALQVGMNAMLLVFGAWAVLTGLLQLGTGVRRWRSHNAQWAMILSGAQSALAGGFFIAQAQMPALPSITTVAGYAAFGAIYFLISAVWLTVRGMRSNAARMS